MEKVILAHIYRPDEKTEAVSYLAECRSLCEACGLEVLAEVTQQSESADPRTAFRRGKLEELRRTVSETGADGVVFAYRLTVAATNRIADYCGVPVIDRTALILQIFSARAKTKQAKLQVESARLQYALPALADHDEIQTHQRGGGYANRGAGEMRSAVIKRRYQSRIRELKQELKAIERENNVAERRRQKTLLGRCALVGYTNAGKSSLMNALLEKCGFSGRNVEAADMLFATLDTSVRSIRWNSKEFLLYDTVGFVSDLPHELVEAFHTTLASARNADLLLHVIDASDPLYARKREITEETLKQIGAEDIPVLRVYTKTDLTDEKAFGGIMVSSVTGEGLENLLEEIQKRLYPADEEMTCLVPYDKMKLVSEGRKILHMETVEEREEGIVLRISGPASFLRPFAKYRIKEEL